MCQVLGCISSSKIHDHPAEAPYSDPNIVDGGTEAWHQVPSKGLCGAGCVRLETKPWGPGSLQGPSDSAKAKQIAAPTVAHI